MYAGKSSDGPGKQTLAAIAEAAQREPRSYDPFINTRGRIRLSALREAVSDPEKREQILLDYIFGLNEEVCKSVAAKRNSVATKRLSIAMRLLQDVSLWANEDVRQRGLALTFNNLAVVHRQRGNLTNALVFLQEALQMELRLRSRPTGIGTSGSLQYVDHWHPEVGETLLNIAAVLNKLDRHREALDVARRAVDELKPGGLEGHSRALVGRRGMSLCTAWFNVGSELEHLNDLQGALKAYDESMQAGVHASRGKSPLLQQVRQAVEECKRRTAGPRASSEKEEEKGHFNPVDPSLEGPLGPMASVFSQTSAEVERSAAVYTSPPAAGVGADSHTHAESKQGDNPASTLAGASPCRPDLDGTYVDKGDMVVDRLPGGRRADVIEAATRRNDVAGSLHGGLATGGRTPSVFEHMHPEAPRPGTGGHHQAARYPFTPALVPMVRAGGKQSAAVGAGQLVSGSRKTLVSRGPQTEANMKGSGHAMDDDDGSLLTAVLLTGDASRRAHSPSRTLMRAAAAAYSSARPLGGPHGETSCGVWRRGRHRRASSVSMSVASSLRSVTGRRRAPSQSQAREDRKLQRLAQTRRQRLLLRDRAREAGGAPGLAPGARALDVATVQLLREVGREEEEAKGRREKMARQLALYKRQQGWNIKAAPLLHPHRPDQVEEAGLGTLAGTSSLGMDGVTPGTHEQAIVPPSSGLWTPAASLRGTVSTSQASAPKTALMDTVTGKASAGTVTGSNGKKRSRVGLQQDALDLIQQVDPYTAAGRAVQQIPVGPLQAGEHAERKLKTALRMKRTVPFSEAELTEEKERARESVKQGGRFLSRSSVRVLQEREAPPDQGGLDRAALEGRVWTVRPVAGDAYMQPPSEEGGDDGDGAIPDEVKSGAWGQRAIRVGEGGELVMAVLGEQQGQEQGQGQGQAGGRQEDGGAESARAREDRLDLEALQRDERELVERAAREAANTLTEGQSEEEMLRQITRDVGRAAKMRLHERIMALTGRAGGAS